MMKKWILFFCTLCLCLVCAAQAESLLGQTAPDFTVTVADGRELTLSALLGEKELVVLNVFATWCPPCAREFPEMEQVYQRYADRMEILALSGDPMDTMEAIAEYQEYFGLSFPMGPAGDAVDFMNVTAFPTTLFIHRSGRIGLVQVGAFANADAFEAAVNAFLDEHYDGSPRALYTFYALYANRFAVSDVYINVCTDTDCRLLQTAQDGIAFLVSEPAIYHVKIVRAPKEYTFDAEHEYYTDLSSSILLLPLSAAQP